MYWHPIVDIQESLLMSGKFVYYWFFPVQLWYKKKRFVTRTWICTNRNRIFKNFEFSIDKKNMENMESVVNMENKVPPNGKKKRFSSIIGAMKGWYLLT